VANHTGTTVSVTGNVVANNGMFTNIVNVASHTGSIVSVTGNVTANNGMFTNIVNVASHTGSIVSVTGNVTANNGMFTNIVNVASHTGSIVSVTGNVTANNFNGNGSFLSNTKPQLFMITAVSDETTAITTGVSKVIFRAPYAMTLYQIPRASLSVASTSGTPTVDINKNGTSIFSTLLTIDANETTSVTAATPAVLSTTTLADDDQISIDIDVAGTGATGLKVTFYYTRT
jgi:hypothetical protein